MLEENGGGAAFITTLRGKNHAHSMHQRYKKLMGEGSRYFAEISNIHDTQALTSEQLAEALEEYIGLNGDDMGPEVYDQEYRRSIKADLHGADYGRELLSVTNVGRLCSDPTTVYGIPVPHAW